MTTIYTNAAFEWDGVAEQYVLKAPQGFEYNGPIIFMKKKLKGVLGKVLTVVAAVFAPVAVPALAASIGVSTWAAGAMYGAAIGGLTGGVKGALMGGVLGGIGGYGAEQGWFGSGGGSLGIGSGGDASGAFGPMPDGSNLAGGPGLQTTVGSYTQGAAVNAPTVGTEALSASVGGGGELAVAPDALNPAASSEAYFDSGMTSSNGSFTNSAQPQAGLDTQYVGNSDPMRLPASDSAVPGEVDRAPWAGGMSNEQYNVATGSTGASPNNFLDSIDWKGAGLKLGAQALGSAIGPQGPDMGKYNSYLESLTDANNQTLEFNKSMANKKAAVGDSLVTNANAMNPDYFGMQEFNRTRNRDNSAKLDAAARMRASGMSEQAIQSEMNKYDIGASQNAASAYDTGWQRGLSAQNSTYGVGGSMYSQISQPGDTVGGSYNTAYNTARQGQQAIGGAIEQAFQPVTKNTTTGTQKTRDQDLYGTPY